MEAALRARQAAAIAAEERRVAVFRDPHGGSAQLAKRSRKGHGAPADLRGREVEGVQRRRGGFEGVDQREHSRDAEAVAVEAELR